MAQNAHFVHSKEDLKRFIDELAVLSRSQITPEDFLRRFLEITLRATEGRGGAIWTFQGSNFQRLYHAEVVENEFTADERHRSSVQSALRDAAQHKRPVVVVPSDAENAAESDIVNHTPFPFFYIPILIPEPGSNVPAVAAVLQVWLAPNLAPNYFKDIVTFLQAAAAQTAAFLRARRVESVAAGSEKVQQLMRFVAEINGQLDFDLLSVTMVNWTREILNCDRVVLFALKPNGKLLPLAVSNVETVDRKSALVQSQMRLANDALKAGQLSLYHKASPKTEALGDLTDYFFHSHSNEAMAVLLVDRANHKVGVLLVESHKDNRIDEPMRRLAVTVALHAGRALGAAQQLEAIPLGRPLRALAETHAEVKADRAKRLLLHFGLPLLVIILIALCPWHFAVSGDCTVEPTVRAHTIAETSGRVVKIFVDEGQHVEAGQRLAQLDDSDIQQEMTVLQQEKLKYQAEGDRSEVAGDEGGRRVAEINVDRTVRQMEQLKRKLDQTYLRSPIAGVVLTKDLPTKLGELLPTGALFCDVADLSAWEVSIQLQESDVALVDEPLRQGKTLPVDFLLHAMPGHPFHASVNDIASLSQLSYQVPRANVFLLKATVNDSPQTRAELKAGYGGSGKIQLGSRSIGYVLTRRFIDYARTNWLF